jgi:hypothetical protein
MRSGGTEKGETRKANQNEGEKNVGWEKIINKAGNVESVKIHIFYFPSFSTTPT